MVQFPYMIGLRDKMNTNSLTLYECGICDHYHPWDFSGDCREDDNRFSSVEDYATKAGVDLWDIEIKTMGERVDADCGVA